MIWMFIKKYRIIAFSNGYLYTRETIILVGKVITVHIHTQKKKNVKCYRKHRYLKRNETKLVHLITMSQSNTSSLWLPKN